MTAVQCNAGNHFFLSVVSFSRFLPVLTNISLMMPNIQKLELF